MKAFMAWTGGALPFNKVHNTLQHFRHGKENLIAPRFLVFGVTVF
jgi:hypothetical protein